MELSEFTGTLARMTPANLHAVARSHAEHHGSPADEIDAFRAVVHIDTVLRKQARTRDAARAAYAATRAVAGAAEAGDILLPDPEVTQVAAGRGADRPRDRRRARGRSRRALAAPRVVVAVRAGVASHRAVGARPRTIDGVPLTDRLLLGPGPSNPYPEVAARLRPARCSGTSIPSSSRCSTRRRPACARSSAPRTR